MDLGKHVSDIASGYSAWRSNWVKDLVLPLIDDMVQLASLLLERVPIKAEFLRSKPKGKQPI